MAMQIIKIDWVVYLGGGGGGSGGEHCNPNLSGFTYNLFLSISSS